MKTKKQVYDLARKLNVEVDHDDGGFSYHVSLYSPKGFIFSATTGHVACTNHNKGFNKGDFWQDVYNDLSSGLQECTDSQCEHCI